MSARRPPNRVPTKVLEQARKLAVETAKATPGPAKASPRSSKAKVISALKRLHPMD